MTLYEKIKIILHKYDDDNILIIHTRSLHRARHRHGTVLWTATRLKRRARGFDLVRYIRSPEFIALEL